MSDFLSVIIVVLIVAIVLDGLRRARKVRRGDIKLSKNVRRADKQYDSDINVSTSEFPSGGARPIGGDKESLNQESETALAQEDRGHSTIEDIEHSSEDVVRAEKRRINQPVSAPRQETLELDVPVPMLMESVKDSAKDGTAAGSDTHRGAADDRPQDMGKAHDGIAEENIARSVDDDAAHIEPKLGAYDDIDVVELSQSPIHSDEKSKESFTSSISKGANTLLAMARNAGAGEEPEAIQTASSEVTKNSRSSSPTDMPEEILVINVMCSEGAFFSGADLLTVFTDQGLRFGQMGIFHRHLDNDGDADIIYSIANMIEPGSFDFARMASTSTPGVSMFLSLPTACEGPAAYDDLVSTARELARRLDGELKDENRSALTNQTIEHGRQRVMEFERKYQLKKRQSEKR